MRRLWAGAVEQVARFRLWLWGLMWVTQEAAANGYRDLDAMRKDVRDMRRLLALTLGGELITRQLEVESARDELAAKRHNELLGAYDEIRLAFPRDVDAALSGPLRVGDDVRLADGSIARVMKARPGPMDEYAAYLRRMSETVASNPRQPWVEPISGNRPIRQTDILRPKQRKVKPPAKRKAKA